MKIGSLFAGIGGIDLGFEQAGFEIAWANEIDKFACMTYRTNFPETLLIESDIRNVDFSQLEVVDVLTAGFPCQPFSVCGKKQGFSDERGNLFFEIMRATDALQPPIIFLENVANLTEHDNGKTFNIIHNELVSRGYIIRYIVADACDYGVPQHRTRTYIVAFKDEDASKRFKFPEKCTLNKHIADVIDMTKEADKSLYYDENSYEYKKLSAVITDSNQIYRFSDYGIQKSKDGISFTLKANMGTWYNRIPIIKDNFGIRKITPYECIALMGFPKEFMFGNIPEKSMYKQCGNSVALILIHKIAKNLLNDMRCEFPFVAFKE